VILFYSSCRVEHNNENGILNEYYISDINYFKVFVNYTKWIDELDTKVDAEVDNLYIRELVLRT
jgi:hypothetical protein